MNIEFYELVITEILAVAGLFITVILAVAGWWIGHYLASLREEKKKKKELRLIYLQRTYKDLTRLRSYASSLKIQEVSALLVGVVADIDLFGTENQIEVMDELSKQLKSEDGSFTKSHELIESLRDDLRAELELAPVKGTHYFIFEGHNFPSGFEYKIQTTDEIVRLDYHPKKEENLTQIT